MFPHYRVALHKFLLNLADLLIQADYNHSYDFRDQRLSRESKTKALEEIVDHEGSVTAMCKIAFFDKPPIFVLPPRFLKVTLNS